MERKLVKGGIYGFVLGLLLAILIFPDQQTFHFGSGRSETTYEPLRTYLFKLLRFSSISAIISIIGVWLKLTIPIHRKITMNVFLKGFIKSFLFVFGVILLALIISKGIR